MEIAILWFLSMLAMNTEIEKTSEQVRQLEVEVVMLGIQNDIIFDTQEDHEDTLIKTATAHSALYANVQLENGAVQDDLDMLESRIEVLEMTQPSE
jgi:hypothetical protein